MAPTGTPAPSASADVFASLDGHGLTGGQQLGGGPGSGFGTGRGRAGSAGTATGGDGDLSGSGTGESTPPPERLGALSGEQIRAVVRRSTAFRRCYAAGLERRPSLSGQVAVEFVIGPDGSVARARARSTDLPDGEVVECIVRAFRELRFPRPTRGSVTVVYPLTFTPA